jgi:hypothetical protein
MNKCVGVFALLLGVASPARGQALVDQRVWSVVTLQHSPVAHERWVTSVDVITRSREGIDELDVFAARAILSCMVTPRLAIGGGFATAASRPTSGGTSMEYRPTMQVAWSRPLGGGTFGLRTRAESRWLDGSSGPVGRARQQARYSRPIRTGSRVALVVSDEFFVHLNNTSRTARGIDQNRFSVGLGLPVGGARTEFSYLHQFSPGHRGARARSNHVLSVSLAVPIS